jgi:hypothetical protein
MARVQCVRAAIAAVVWSSCVALTLLLPAGASAASYTVDYTYHDPAFLANNRCNNDTVNLSGDFHIRMTTTPRLNGTTVQSSVTGLNLRGWTVVSTDDPLLPQRRYRGDDRTNTYSFEALPPYPTTYSVTHWQKLVPEGNYPTMYLVTVFRETVLLDGTPALPTLEAAYVTCTQPKCSHRRDD